MEDYAIKVENVSKVFKLPHEKQFTVKSAFVNVLGKNKGFELQNALNNVSFEVKKGEFFGIVGRNGSGKSTLLKLLAGIYTPTNGKVHIRGSLTPFIELGVGFNPELTGRENVFLNGALLGFNRKEMQKMYKDIVDFAELAKFMDQKLKNYSSGMQVRLAFSIAIRAKSDILLIDEVLAVGDEAFQQKCFKYFNKLKTQSKTVVFVTHDMESFTKYCNRGILIDTGRIIYNGEPLLVSTEYKTINSPNGNNTAKVGELNFDNSINVTTINGSKSVALTQKDKITIEALIKPLKNHDNVAVGLSVLRSDGVYIAFHNTRGSVDKIRIKKGKHYTFTYMISASEFMPGVYSVDIALYNKNDNYIDLKNQACKFVITGDDKARSGLLNLHGKWEFSD